MKFLKKVQKEEKGVTMITLAVTIIVLLIITLIVVRMSIDEDQGLINEAQKATEQYEGIVDDTESDMDILYKNR